MIGSWRWNLIAAGAFGALIFLVSYGNNPPVTAAYRAGVSCFVGFTITYAVRYLLSQAISPAGVRGLESDGLKADQTDPKGQSIDIVTPDEEEEAELSFAPLLPPKLVKTEQPIDPEQLAKALRHMSEK